MFIESLWITASHEIPLEFFNCKQESLFKTATNLVSLAGIFVLL